MRQYAAVGEKWCEMWMCDAKCNFLFRANCVYSRKSHRPNYHRHSLQNPTLRGVEYSPIRSSCNPTRWLATLRHYWWIICQNENCIRLCYWNNYLLNVLRVPSMYRAALCRIDGASGWVCCWDSKSKKLILRGELHSGYKALRGCDRIPAQAHFRIRNMLNLVMRPYSVGHKFSLLGRKLSCPNFLVTAAADRSRQSACLIATYRKDEYSRKASLSAIPSLIYLSLSETSNCDNILRDILF